MRVNIVHILLILFLVACNQTNEQPKKQKKMEEQKKYADPRDEFIQFDTILSEKVIYMDSIVDWKGYFRVKESLEDFKNNTVNEVLNSSDQLVQHIDWMRDTISVEALNDRGMRSIMNILHNHSLRLQEMKNIPSITIPEVKKQTQGLFVIFRMMNRKINEVYKQKDFENELLEDDFFFSKLDSIQ